MSRSRIGSLGRRLSYWLALQSLVGLVVVCAAVYGATQLAFPAPPVGSTGAEAASNCNTCSTEAARDGDIAGAEAQARRFPHWA